MTYLVKNTYTNKEGKTVEGLNVAFYGKDGEPQLADGESVVLTIDGSPKAWRTFKNTYSTSTLANFKLDDGTKATSFVRHTLRGDKPGTFFHENLQKLNEGDRIKVTRTIKTVQRAGPGQGKPFSIYTIEVLGRTQTSLPTSASTTTPSLSPMVLVEEVPSLKLTEDQTAMLGLLSGRAMDRTKLVATLVKGARKEDGTYVTFTKEQAETIAESPALYGLTKVQ